MCAVPGPPRNHGFVSATPSRAVAESCATRSGIVLEPRVPVERIFMSDDETPLLRARFAESEIVLLWDSPNSVF